MKFIDLFSGIGGFRSALEELGHECIAYSEIDKFAIKSYKAIYDTDGEIELGNISEISDEYISKLQGEVDIVVGGSPCQSFSIAGNRGGFDDTRGTLFFEYARTVKDIQPKYFIFENVKGMLSHDKGNTIRTVLNTFNDLGYYIDFNVFNSKYYGVPQNRERIYIVGKRKDLVPSPKFHEKKKKKIKLDEIHNWAVENIQYVNLLPELKTVVNKRLVDILEEEVDEKFFLDEEKTERLLERIKNREVKNNYSKQVADYRYDEGLRIREEGISPCLTANMRSMGTDNKDLSNAVYVIGSTQKNAFIGNGEYSPALTSAMGTGGGHVPMVVGESNFSQEEPKITVVGNTSNTGHRSQDVHDVNGIIPTIAARDYKGPKQVMVEDVELTTKESEIDYYAYDDVVISENVAEKIGKISDNHYAYLYPTVANLENGLKLIINNEATQAELLHATEDEGVYISLGVYTDTNNEITSKDSFGRFGNQAIETLISNLDVAKHGDTINAFNRTLDSSGVSPTLTTRPDGFKTAILPIITPDRVKKSQNGRVMKEDGEPMFTLTSSDIHGIYNGHRIRKLTPLECWRLQGFSDEQFDKAQQAGLSNSQLYKQAGNAVTVNVVKYIVDYLLEED